MKRALFIIAALLVCGAIGSAARAQTPAQAAKFSHYLSKHPAVAQRLAANQGLGNASSYMASYPGAQNYSSAYQTQYMKNMAIYDRYLATHPWLANQGMGNVNPYMASYPGQYSAGYPGQYGYPPTQQLASSPIMALVAPVMSGYGTGGYGGGGYGGGYGAAPMYPSPYAATSYARPMPYGNPYGAYGGAPTSQPWHHHHGFFGTTSSASHAAWAASHPYASAGHHGWWSHNH